MSLSLNFCSSNKVNFADIVMRHWWPKLLPAMSIHKHRHSCVNKALQLQICIFELQSMPQTCSLLPCYLFINFSKIFHVFDDIACHSMLFTMLEMVPAHWSEITILMFDIVKLLTVLHKLQRISIIFIWIILFVIIDICGQMNLNVMHTVSQKHELKEHSISIFH